MAGKVVGAAALLLCLGILLVAELIFLMHGGSGTASRGGSGLGAGGAVSLSPKLEMHLLRLTSTQQRIEDQLGILATALARLEQQGSSSVGRSQFNRRIHAKGQASEAVDRLQQKMRMEDPQKAEESEEDGRGAADASRGKVGRSRSGPDSPQCDGRVPYHTLLTSQGNPYQQWQSRIMYFHWKKQQAAGGACTEMEGFTRLCATPNGAPDGLEGEIPTIFTHTLPEEVIASHFYFNVLNRPESIRQLLASPSLLAQITSSFVLVLETDHVLMQPIPNLATPTQPAAYVFGYMHAQPAQDYIIKRYWPEGSSKQLQPVGPSPLLIHLDQLRALTPRWLNFSLGLRSNADAERVMQGWVQEMWGYSIAAASVGIRHRLVGNFQVEHGSLSRDVPEDFDKHAYIFHYTYGIEYTLDGRPQGINQIGEWSLDKRHYGSDHPPRHLQPPPEGANAAARWLHAAWNEASAGIEAWPESHSMGTIGWRREKISAEQLASSELARRVQQGKWSWGGVPGLLFGAGGELTTPWGAGAWGLVTAAAATEEEQDEDGINRCTDCIFADFANANHNLRFDFSASPATFKAVRVGDMAVVHGALSG